MKLKPEFYEMIQEDPFLMGKLLKIMRSQNEDSIISMAHVKHNVFTENLTVLFTILNHYNESLPSGEKLSPNDIIAEFDGETVDYKKIRINE